MADPLRPDGTDGAPSAADGPDLDLLLPPAVGWRARLDDLTGGLASSLLRPTAVLAAVVAVVAVVVVLRWSPGGPSSPPALPAVEVGGGPAPGSAPRSSAADAAPTAPTGPSPAPTTVHVVGAVVAPGLQVLAEGDRVADAVAAAGGPTPDADLEQLNLAEPVRDGSQIRVPRRGEVVPAPVVGPAGPGGATPLDPGLPLSLNGATATELEALPGVGPATAQAIVDHREANGPFRSVDDLLAVRGIGEKRLAALRDLVVP